MNYALEAFLPPTPPVHKESLDEFFFMRLMPSQRVAGCGCGEPPRLPGATPDWLGGTGHGNAVVLPSG